MSQRLPGLYNDPSLASPQLTGPDRLWVAYVSGPERAADAFFRHAPAFTCQPEYSAATLPATAEVSPRLHAVAAFCGLLVAAEAGDDRAVRALRKVQPAVQKLDGAMVAMFGPHTPHRNEQSAPVLAVYFASSAAEPDSTNTAWEQTPAMKAAAAAAAGLRVARGIRQAVQDRKLPRPQLLSAAGAAPESPGGAYRTDRMDEVARAHLAHYLQQPPYELHLQNDHELLAAAAGVIVKRMGALPAYFNSPQDLMPRQLIRDYVENVRRCVQTNDLNEGARRLRRLMNRPGGFDFARAYLVGEMLLADTDVPVKKYGRSLVSRVQKIWEDKPAPATPRYPTRMRADVLRQRIEPALPMFGGEGGATATYPFAPRLLGDLRRRTTTTVHARAMKDTFLRLGEGKRAHRLPLPQRLMAWEPTIVADIIEAAHTGDTTFDWQSYMATVVLRRDSNILSRPESKMLHSAPDILPSMTLRSQWRNNSLANLAPANSDGTTMLAALEVFSWLGQVYGAGQEREGCTPQQAAKLYTAYFQAFETQARAEYKLPTQVPISPRLATVLCGLTAAHRMLSRALHGAETPQGPADLPPGTFHLIAASLRRVRHSMEERRAPGIKFGSPLVPASLPPLAQTRYAWLQARSGEEN